MPISQKCQYAVRSVFKLAKRQGSGATKISDVAEAQAIPVRFLENILNQLKGGGFVESVRGKEGGYLLARSAKELTVGEIVRYMEGPLSRWSAIPEEGRAHLPGMDAVSFCRSGNLRKRLLKRFTMERPSRILYLRKASTAKPTPWIFQSRWNGYHGRFRKDNFC